MKKENQISKVNSNLTSWNVSIALGLTEKIIRENRINWWHDLEYNWKVILLANYCFNYDEYNTWNIRDCDIECPAHSENQSNVDYLIGFALWVGGDIVGGTRDSFEEHLNEIPEKIIDFILDKTRFLWCSGVSINNLHPINRLSNLKDVAELECFVSVEQINLFAQKFNYFSYHDCYTKVKKEIGRRKTWEEYNK